MTKKKEKKPTKTESESFTKKNTRKVRKTDKKPGQPTEQITDKKTRDSLNVVDYIHSEPKFGDFEIRKTANGWWSSENGGPTKLASMISAIKLGMSELRACSYSGISQRQWQYFKDEHPEFCVILPELGETLVVNAYYQVAKRILNNTMGIKDLQWFLERKAKDEFSPRNEIVDPGELGEEDYEKLKEEHSRLFKFTSSFTKKGD